MATRVIRVQTVPVSIARSVEQVRNHIIEMQLSSGRPTTLPVRDPRYPDKQRIRVEGEHPATTEPEVFDVYQDDAGNVVQTFVAGPHCGKRVTFMIADDSDGASVHVKLEVPFRGQAPSSGPAHALAITRQAMKGLEEHRDLLEGRTRERAAAGQEN